MSLKKSNKHPRARQPEAEKDRTPIPAREKTIGEKGRGRYRKSQEERQFLSD